MSQEAFVTPTTEIAVIPVSAPIVSEEKDTNLAVTTESAPVIEIEEEIVDENIEESGAKPSKAIRELIAKRKENRELSNKVAFLEGMMAGREKVQEPTPIVKPVVQEIKKPESSQFETWEEYETAKDEYIRASTEQRVLQTLQQAQQQQVFQQQNLTFQQKLDKAAKEDPVIADIITDRTFPMNPIHLPIIQGVEKPEGILKYLNENREEAVKIYHMNPLMAARELGRIEAQVKLAPKPVPAKKVSTAPEPISTITPAASLTMDEDKLPIDEWMTRRNKAQYGRK